MERTTVEGRQGDGRRFLRVPMLGTVNYRYGALDGGTARLSNVGRGGFAAHMGRYLRPGTRAMVWVPELRVDEEPFQLKSEIAWCVPAEQKHEFVAGFRVICDEPDAVAAVSNWVHTALAQGDFVPRMPHATWRVVRGADQEKMCKQTAAIQAEGVFAVSA